jgi:hypothetical protein
MATSLLFLVSEDSSYMTGAELVMMVVTQLTKSCFS